MKWKWHERQLYDDGWRVVGPGQYCDISLTMSYDNSWNDEHKNCWPEKPNVPSRFSLGLFGQGFS